MSKATEKWHSVSVPRVLLLRIKAVLGFTTDQSVAEYVRHAVVVRLMKDENHAEEQKMMEKEIRERLKD